jgi:hypothetical protein
MSPNEAFMPLGVRATPGALAALDELLPPLLT